MRSVCWRSLAMSIWSSRQWLTISSAASFGIRPMRPCTLASAASMSRYFWVRFSSDQTWRISSLVKMPWKIAESMIVDAMVLVSGKRWNSVPGALQGALCLEDDRAVDHPAVDAGDARRRGIRGEDAACPVEGLGAGRECGVDRSDLLRVDAELGVQPVPARPGQVGEQARLVVE